MKMMEQAIAGQIFKTARERRYIRFAVVDKGKGVPVGTAAMFGTDGVSGVLRLDLVFFI